MTNDEMEPFIAAARESKRIRERGGWTRPAQCTVIVALAERVAKLERDAMHCNTCGGRCDGDCEEGDEQSASGQPASAGGATVPTGWKLAPGWRLSSYGADGTGCSGGEDEHWGKSRAAYVRGGMFDRTGACAAHAVEMGALVRDEPSAERCGNTDCGPNCTHGASVVCGHDDDGDTCDNQACRVSEPPDEQPSRQETPGGETGEAIDWSRFVPTEEIPEDLSLSAYDALVVGDVFASWDLLHGGSVNRSLGIDRAERLAGGGCWWQRRVRLIRHADGRWADGYHGASVDATGSATEFEAGPCRPDCGSSDGCKSNPCFFVHAGKTYHFCTPFCRARFEADRAKAKAAEQTPLPVLFPDAKPSTQEDRERISPSPRIENDEPPAPPAGTLSARVRERCRFYTDDIRRGWIALADEVAALEARLAQAEHARDVEMASRKWLQERCAQTEREREEWHARHESQRLEVLKWQDREEELLVLRRERDEWRDEATSRLNVAVTAKRERDDATANERARCLAWFLSNEEHYVASDAIREGKPAPGADKDVSENCASAAKAFAENTKDRPPEDDDPQGGRCTRP